MPPDDAEEREKAALAQELQAAASQCQQRFAGRPELATEAEPSVLRLCAALERALAHGLARPAGAGAELAAALRHVSGLGPRAAPAFWPCVREQLSWHERERFDALRRVRSEQGRARAWLRAALNERSLERQLRGLLGGGALRRHYGPRAFVLDRERCSLLPAAAAGLGGVLFALPVDREELDDGGDGGSLGRPVRAPAEPLIAAHPPDAASPRVKLRKKVQAHVISFDDEAVAADAGASAAALAGRGLDREIDCLSVSCGSAGPGAMQDARSGASAPLPEAGDAPLDVESSRWQHNGDSFEERLLTPLTDGQLVGGLMPVSPIALDDALTGLPSYPDMNGATEAAVEATEPFISSCTDADTMNVEALKLRLSALSEIVEQTREEADTSRLELARFQKYHENYKEKHELQIQTLNRENELLRQQLRKYVTAVQLLEENSAASAAVKEDSSSGYHKESEQYQIKLIQVAEMHAELMEFNARLTMQLNNKDKLVKLLEAELECLRGPINEEDIPSRAPCLIHIWIPCAFLTGHAPDIHHVYQVYIRIRDTEWNIYRRYAQFHALYRELKREDSVITSFEFPPKKTIGNKDARFVEDRRQKLQQWLRRIVNRLSHSSGAFSRNPTKQTFISLLPFFGDLPHNLESRRNNSSGNTYSSTSPQYMGL